MTAGKCLMVISLGIMAIANAEPTLDQTDVFVSGQDGYHTFRIPAIVSTKQGTLLAFCEGRRDGQGDSGQIDLVLKRSSDLGKTWSGIQLVCSAEGYTTGNPAPIVERVSGDIVLPFTRNGSEHQESRIMTGEDPPRTAWVMRSADEGRTWSEPVEISASVRQPEWRWYATGPGHGIQLANGVLMAACDHSTSDPAKKMLSHVIYSEDAGITWKLGGSAEEKTDESTVVELPDGRLYLNMRTYRKTDCRGIAFSSDQGKTWSPVQNDETLIEPVCQGSCIGYDTKDGKHFVLFSNPASKQREKMTIRLSQDNCKTWPAAKELYPGPAAYSDLVVLPDGTVGCLYERGEKSAYERIAFARFPLEWLLAK